MNALRRADLVDLVPLVRRVSRLDPGALVRLRHSDRRLSAFVRLPFGVLAGRTIATACPDAAAIDTTVGATELLAWLDNEALASPDPRDTAWRGGMPPNAGWARIDVVPDSVVRDLVRTGALTLKTAAAREGVPDAQPRAEVADALLDSVVLTVSDEAGHSAHVTLRLLSALTRLGFLARDSHIAVDLHGRWTRVAAEYGSVYAERPGLGLNVL